MCSEATITTRPAHGKKFAIGTVLSLRCRCPSSSPGTTRWIKNGITVSATNGRITVDQRKLNINSTSFADSGNYTCYVTVAELGTAKSETVEIWGKKTYMHGTCILVSVTVGEGCFPMFLKLDRASACEQALHLEDIVVVARRRTWKKARSRTSRFAHPLKWTALCGAKRDFTRAIMNNKTSFLEVCNAS